MKLDRNLNRDGKGKYALVRLRGDLTPAEQRALQTLVHGGRVDLATPSSPEEFFAIKLKDKYAQAALRAYADAAKLDDPEYAREVRELADRAGPRHPLCKAPD
ncbi:hypothetical protein [Rhodospirillaceae bacterium SYSU D60014]|uniref:hypothetical protein n=1 Tax=Virgifigura deserti TaxID=2268457 RepID=UPI000E65EC0D